jgi:hypothetical protein
MWDMRIEEVNNYLFIKIDCLYYAGRRTRHDFRTDSVQANKVLFAMLGIL